MQSTTNLVARMLAADCARAKIPCVILRGRVYVGKRHYTGGPLAYWEVKTPSDIRAVIGY